MPYKLRNSGRHKFEKVKFKINNWRDYNQALINRGSIMLWLSPEIIKAWHPKKCKLKLQGGQFKYSDMAIEAAVTIKTALHMPYRATQGFLASVLKLINLNLATPNYTTLCRRIAKLELPQLSKIGKDRSINIVADSTGLKIFGQGEWHEYKHRLTKSKQWCKLHLTIDRDSHAIIAQELTINSLPDDSQVAIMLENIQQHITHFAADKAYDKSNVYQAVHDKAGHDVTIAIPPIKNGIPATHPLTSIELRALRQLQRDNDTSPYVFVSERKAPLTARTVRHIIARAGLGTDLKFTVHPHMLRHSTVFYLANKGHDTRAIQSYMGHSNINNTVIYTELSSKRFNGFWND